MALSTLNIRFSGNPAVVSGPNTEFQRIRIVASDQSTIVGYNEEYRTTRTQNYTFGRGGSLQQTLFNLAIALQFDYASSPGFGSAQVIGDDTVRVTVLQGWDFISFSDSGFDDITITYNDANDPAPPVETLAFTVSFSERALNPCTSITTNINITGGIAPYSTTVDGFTIANTGANPSVPKQRGVGVLIRVRDSRGGQVTRSVTTPQRIVPASFNVNIFQSPTGSTVSIRMVTGLGLSGLEYSLDNINFSSNNTFSGQTPGDYTAYVRDGFGCTISINYTISDISPEPLDPFFLYAEANMVRMYEVQADTPSIRANYYNRQSCNEYVRGIAYQNAQYWEPDDNLYIQFKTNHDDVQLFSVDPDGNESSLGIPTIVQNIGLTDGRDCKYFRDTQSTLGVYFDSGNTYDFDSMNVNGTYALINGLLPFFVVEGVFFNIIGLGFKEVLSTAYDANRQVWYAVVSGATASTVDVETQCYTTYNNQVYDVYATTVPMSSRLNTNFKLKITTDQTEWLSEEQRVISNVRGVVIDYFNTENRYDIVYAIDPQPFFRLRMPDMDISNLQPDSRVENYESDDAPIQLDNKLYKNFELRCEDLSTAMAFKVLLALTHNAVTVNGLTMTFKEVGEYENYENTNLYAIRVIMIEGGDAAARQREDAINLTLVGAIGLEANLGLINYNA